MLRRRTMRPIMGNIALLVFLAFLSLLTIGFAPAPAGAVVTPPSKTADVTASLLSRDYSGATYDLTLTLTPVTPDEFDNTVTVQMFNRNDNTLLDTKNFRLGDGSVSGAVYSYNWTYVNAVYPSLPVTIQVVYQGELLKTVDLDMEGPVPRTGMVKVSNEWLYNSQNKQSFKINLLAGRAADSAMYPDGGGFFVLDQKGRGIYLWGPGVLEMGRLISFGIGPAAGGKLTAVFECKVANNERINGKKAATVLFSITAEKGMNKPGDCTFTVYGSGGSTAGTALYTASGRFKRGVTIYDTGATTSTLNTTMTDQFRSFRLEDID